MITRSRSRSGAARGAGLAMLAAALLLGVFSASAFGAPKNTALPTISPSAPVIGEAATATTGTWNSEASAHWLEGGSTKLKEGEKANVTAYGNPITYAATIGGYGGSITCETTVSGASLENPSGGAAGVGNAEITYENCAAAGGWTECAATFSAAVPVKLELSTVEGKAKIALSPVGANLGAFSLSGAKCAIPGTYKLVGVINGLYSNPGSQIEFNPATSGTGTLRIGSKAGPKTTANGAIGLEMSKGGNIGADSLTYSYQWNSCAEACSEIAGATASTYTPVAADIGKNLTVSLTATDTTGATAATSSKTGAIKGNFNWYACGEWGEPGVYEDADCTTKGASNPFSWSQLTSMPFTSSNNVEATTIGWNWAGVYLEILCTGGSGEGTLANTASQADVEEFDLTLTECWFTAGWIGCQISSGGGSATLAFNSLKAKSVLSTKPQLNFEPEAGITLVEFTVKNCAFAGNYKFTGWFPALFHNDDYSGGGVIRTDSAEIKASEGMKFQTSILAGMESAHQVLGEGSLPIKLGAIAP